jgi:hypothetical protein
MFTFGIFSTHMPYVIMIFSYAVYFLFASPVADRLTRNLAENDQETTELVQDDEQSVESVQVCYHLDYWTNRPLKHTLPVALTLIYPPPDPPGLENVYTSLPFNRPPPSFS